MEKSIKIQQKIKLMEILSCNTNLEQRIKADNWVVNYRKEPDMLIIGAGFPDGTFYFNFDDSGLMIRIDKNNKIYGFAIENAKFFLERNSSIKPAFYPYVHPIKSFFLHYANRTLGNLNQLKSILRLNDYVKQQFV